MKKLLLIITVTLAITGCQWQRQQLDNTKAAFIQGCVLKTISASLEDDGETLTLKATCKKEK